MSGCSSSSPVQPKAEDRTNTAPAHTTPESDGDWPLRAERVIQLLKAGEIQKAETAGRALESSAPADVASAQALTNVAEQFRQAARYSLAETLTRRSLQIRETLASKEGGISMHLEVAACLNVLARLKLDQKQPAEAMRLLDQSIKITISMTGGQTADMVAPTAMTAEACRQQGKLDEAERHYDKALELARTYQAGTPEESKLTEEYLRFLEQIHRADKARAIIDDSAWRKLYQSTGRAFGMHQYTEAERLGLETVRLAAAFGRLDPRLSCSRVQLADIYRKEAKPELAEPLLRLAVTDLESCGRTNVAELLLPLDTMTALYSQQPGRTKDAVAASERSLAIASGLADADPADIAARAHSLAHLQSAVGNPARAEALFELAIRKAQQAHADVSGYLFSLAEFYRSNHMCGPAEAAASRAVALRESAVVSGDSNTALSLAAALASLARIQLDCGGASNAEAGFTRSLQLAESAIGSANEDLVPTLTGLAEAQALEGETSRAEAQLKRAVQLTENGSSPDSVELVPILDQYAQLLRRQNRWEEANALNARATRLRAVSSSP